MEIVKHRFKKYFQPVKRDLDWGIYLLGCGDYTSPNIEMPEDGRYLNDYAIVYFTEGEGLFYIDKENAIPWSTGDVILLFPGVWHKYVSENSQNSKQLWIVFNGSYVRHLQKNNFLSTNNSLIHIGFDTELHNLFNKIETLAETESLTFQIESGAELIKLLARIIKLSDKNKSVPIQPVICKSIDYIEENPEKEIDFEDFSKSNGISYIHFRRQFKQSTGLAPLQYQMQVKINKAKILLETDKSVKEVAFELGFKCQYYFSRKFKEKTGIPPSEWTYI
ncbi:MAG: AraC family transcriptional regulator [Spirochaetaceae bacterium]